jgi:uncharacterized cupredoxin-like copper-binding protein
MTNAIRPAIAVALVAIALTACGSDTVPTTTTAAPEPLPSGTIEVAAVDFGFEGLPARVAAGTTFELVNKSSAELHELVAIRLPDDEQRPASELMQLPPEEFAAFFPLVTSVVLAPPESGGFAAVGTGTLDEPGRYAFICAIPTGADPHEYLAAAAESEGGPPQVDGGPPHFAHGMFAEVIVE